MLKLLNKNGDMVEFTHNEPLILESFRSKGAKIEINYNNNLDYGRTVNYSRVDMAQYELKFCISARSEIEFKALQRKINIICEPKRPFYLEKNGLRVECTLENTLTYKQINLIAAECECTIVAPKSFWEDSKSKLENLGGEEGLLEFPFEFIEGGVIDNMLDSTDFTKPTEWAGYGTGNMTQDSNSVTITGIGTSKAGIVSPSIRGSLEVGKTYTIGVDVKSNSSSINVDIISLDDDTPSQNSYEFDWNATLTSNFNMRDENGDTLFVDGSACVAYKNTKVCLLWIYNLKGLAYVEFAEPIKGYKRCYITCDGDISYRFQDMYTNEDKVTTIYYSDKVTPNGSVTNNQVCTPMFRSGGGWTLIAYKSEGSSFNNKTGYIQYNGGSEFMHELGVATITNVSSSSMTRKTVSFTPTRKMNNCAIALTSSANNQVSQYKCIKLEVGSTASDWNPSLYDNPDQGGGIEISKKVSNALVNIYNSGDHDSNVKLVIRFYSEVKSPKICNLTTGSCIEFVSTFYSGDTLVFDNRNGIISEVTSRTRANRYVTPSWNSDFNFSLKPGDNTIRVSAAENGDYMDATIEYKELFMEA